MANGASPLGLRNGTQPLDLLGDTQFRPFASGEVREVDTAEPVQVELPTIALAQPDANRAVGGY